METVRVECDWICNWCREKIEAPSLAELSTLRKEHLKENHNIGGKKSGS